MSGTAVGGGGPEWIAEPADDLLVGVQRGKERMITEDGSEEMKGMLEVLMAGGHSKWGGDMTLYSP